MSRPSLQRSAAVAGPVVAVVVAAASSAVRDQVGASIVGIALAAVVVMAAFAGRLAALTTAATAALTFNFFHTKPYHSLRVTSTRDVAIIAILAALGLLVSDVSAWMRLRDAVGAGRLRARSAPGRLLSILDERAPVAEVWPMITTSIMDQLALADCRYHVQQPVGLAIVSRVAGRSADGDDGFVLPGQGAAVTVNDGPRSVGYLVVQPRHGVTSLWVERRVVLALADHLAIALTYTGHETAGHVRTKENNS